MLHRRTPPIDPRPTPTWLERLLFTTALGDRILAHLETRHALAIVNADELGYSRPNWVLSSEKTTPAACATGAAIEH